MCEYDTDSDPLYKASATPEVERPWLSDEGRAAFRLRWRQNMVALLMDKYGMDKAAAEAMATEFEVEVDRLIVEREAQGADGTG